MAFEWEVIELSYFTYIFLWVKPFLYYQSQGQISRTQFSKKMAVAWGICVSQTHLVKCDTFIHEILEIYNVFFVGLINRQLEIVEKTM